MILDVATITDVELWKGFCVLVAIFGSSMEVLTKSFFLLLPCIMPDRMNVRVSKLLQFMKANASRMGQPKTISAGEVLETNSGLPSLASSSGTPKREK